MLVKPKYTNGELILSKVSYEKVDKQYCFMFDEHKELLFKIEKCKLKFGLNDDKKITIVHDSTIPKIIHDLISRKLESDKFVSKCENTLSLKVKKDNIINQLKDLKPNSLLDIGVKFNNCWEMNGKIYWSFDLVHLQVLKSVEKVQKVEEDYDSYFVNDDEENI
jgi:hypothetical protein